MKMTIEQIIARLKAGEGKVVGMDYIRGDRLAERVMNAYGIALVLPDVASVRSAFESAYADYQAARQ